MPKMRTHRGAAKRFSKTGSGKLQRNHAFHSHILGDVIGARGPDGYQWPIPYLLPFSRTPELVWSGQWALNAWQNFVITAIALSLTFYIAWSRGHSPLEIFSSRADRAFVETLRTRFPRRRSMA